MMSVYRSTLNLSAYIILILRSLRRCLTCVHAKEANWKHMSPVYYNSRNSVIRVSINGPQPYRKWLTDLSKCDKYPEEFHWTWRHTKLSQACTMFWFRSHRRLNQHRCTTEYWRKSFWPVWWKFYFAEVVKSFYQ